MNHCSHHLHYICWKKYLVMGASWQSLQPLSGAVLQLPGIIWVEGLCGVSQMTWKVVLVE